VSLIDYGWNDRLAGELARLDEPELKPGRVLLGRGGWFRVVTDRGEREITLAGRLKHSALSAADIPTVGDWVALRDVPPEGGRIEHVLERRTTLSRKVPGRRNEEQVVAANVDVALLVMGLDGDYSLPRLERLLATVSESGAEAVVLLNKTDLCEDVEARRLEVEAVAGDCPVLVLSCKRNEGVEAVRARLEPRTTAVLLGSSGVGKSTLINRLIGEEIQETRSVREGDDRGRHTTVHRELFRLAGGALIIDNPGIRELQLWAGEDSLDDAFDDIAELAEACRFRDCRHESEAGCAVLAAVEAGELTPARLRNYHDLQKEVRSLERRRSGAARQIERRKWRTIHKEMRRFGKHRRR
jgi:ribosome biogenesis GTPase